MLARKFHEAAEIYGQQGSEFASKLTDKQNIVESCMNQGTAYKNNSEFDNAEVTLLHGLRELFALNASSAFSASGIGGNCFGLLTRHLTEVYQFRLGLDGDEAVSAKETMIMLFSMSQLAGSPVPAADLFPAERMVKSQYHAKSAARKAIAAAFKTKTAEEFTQMLRHWKQAGAPLDVAITNKQKQGVDYSTARGLKSAAKNDMRSNARQQSTVPERKCYYPDCPLGHIALDKLSQCAKCKIAQYCSRDCQVAHWKDHKPMCLAARS
jgi:hypothetical protein